MAAGGGIKLIAHESFAYGTTLANPDDAKAIPKLAKEERKKQLVKSKTKFLCNKHKSSVVKTRKMEKEKQEIDNVS